MTTPTEHKITTREHLRAHQKLKYIRDHLADVFQRSPEARVLDFGCGNGSAVSQYLISTLPSTATYIGVDIHPASIEHANAHYSRPNAVFVDSVPNDCFDAIVYADVLEHLDQPLQTLSLHQANLKPCGTIVGSIPNGIGPYEIENAIDRRFKVSQRVAAVMTRVRGNTKSAVPYNSESGHLQFYRKGEFVRLLASAGFRVIDFKNGTFFGAMITERLLRFGGEPLMRANAAVAEALPFWAVSTWLFKAERL
ncbi:MAG: methyltransferase domain-containing protein [Rhodospirillales bacterium]|nr:methyltransferase domain-containing protein [Rhodospirillales bacterium]